MEEHEELLLEERKALTRENLRLRKALASSIKLLQKSEGLYISPDTRQRLWKLDNSKEIDELMKVL